MVDATTVSVIGLLSGALGFVARSVFSAGQKESSFSTAVDGHGKKLDEHGRRLDGHDTRFAGLNTDFVPRPEVEFALKSIQEGQRESKQLLLHLVTNKTIEPTIND